MTESENITELLKAWVSGDMAARELLIPIVYKELHRLAHYYRRRVGAGETIQTTALVHEAYIRMVDINDVEWNDRVHFFSVSSQLMRRILVDAARARAADKRGGFLQRSSVDNLDEIVSPSSKRSAELIALDDALSRLNECDPRRARNVELRIFGGLTVEESAEILGISPQTVMRDWKFSKSWLLRELST
ncbi:RNA polymerase sigma factor (TIGR02999 family) [Granulicella aggregans]|uniref:RNA polymerase sigma factor (TIGR02999 family) n=1 Tax=Granulicella aggregans TaxID=474949 RepID=A0A7W7ZGC0_9BACT|nr:sigma-70 family RNA polymerase sigma factor [Granulicella aggregans]MBB5059114.1 RNA polymerase sigma factor (TIGR02999 family) [Granulicella aggregans]